MTKYRDLANVLKTAKAIRYRDASNVLRTVKTIRYRDASNVLRTVYGSSALVAVASPDSCDGYGYSSGSIRVTTNATAVSVTGGSGSYTYAWTFPGALGWSAVSPTSSATQFRSPLLAAGDTSSDTAVCTVTDTVTGGTTTVNVIVSGSNSF